MCGIYGNEYRYLEKCPIEIRSISLFCPIGRFFEFIKILCKQFYLSLRKFLAVLDFMNLMKACSHVIFIVNKLSSVRFMYCFSTSFKMIKIKNNKLFSLFFLRFERFY